MLPVAVGYESAALAGLAYRCRDCDQVRTARYETGRGTGRVLVARLADYRSGVGPHGGGCWCCDTIVGLSAYRASGGRLSAAELAVIAHDVTAGRIDPTEVLDAYGLIVSCPRCAPTSAAAGVAVAAPPSTRILARLNARTAPRGPLSATRAA